MKKQLLLTFFLCASIFLNAQTLYVPSGTGGIGTSTNGNVGIGIATPSTKLEIANSTLVKSRFNSTEFTGAGGILQFSRPDDGIYELQMGVSAAPNDDGIITQMGGGTQLRLGSKTGIGFYIGQTNTAMFAGARPVPNMFINSAGNVGIGITTPTLNSSGRVLHIHDASSNSAAIHFTNNSYGSTATDGLVVGRMNDNRNYLWTYENEPLALGTNNIERITILSGGNVGIGTTAPPVEKLEVAGNILLGTAGQLKLTNGPFHGLGYAAIGNIDGPVLFGYSGGALASTGVGGNKIVLQWNSAGSVLIGQTNLPAGADYKLNVNGKVLIGNDIPPAGDPNNYQNYELAVDGNIVCKKVVVTTLNWPDYVFATKYKLNKLEEVEKFIQKNGHLPGFAPANEYEKNGADLEQLVRKQQEKIEELTLYLIEQKKEIEALKVAVKKN